MQGIHRTSERGGNQHESMAHFITDANANTNTNVDKVVFVSVFEYALIPVFVFVSVFASVLVSDPDLCVTSARVERGCKRLESKARVGLARYYPIKITPYELIRVAEKKSFNEKTVSTIRFIIS